MAAHVCQRIVLSVFSTRLICRANREKSNLIGWRETLTTSAPNHILFLLVRAKPPSEKGLALFNLSIYDIGRVADKRAPRLVVPQTSKSKLFDKCSQYHTLEQIRHITIYTR